VSQLLNNSPQRFDYAEGVASGGCTDIDMLWERHGHFLAIENKRPGEKISLGQLIALRALAEKPEWTVWVIEGLPPDLITSGGVLDFEPQPTTLEELRNGIQAWWDAH
jgi:hypothetical protein